MKIPFSWLQEYVDLPNSIEKISDVLTMAGIEIEGVSQENDETILEISLTPNLGHCMSVVGIARELAALLKLPLKRHQIQFKENSSLKTQSLISVEIQDKQNCSRYSCRLVQNVKIGPSPDWLKKRLEYSGIRSINNVVDIGNLVMLECGQPLHLFDYDKIEGKKIIVKSAQGMQRMKTLDEEPREIPEDVLLVCDAKEPIAFAGVMGGADSAVTEKTKNILIESAHFAPESVRKTSKLLGLRTESSGRFERGVDPMGTLSALNRTAQLLAEIAHGSITEGEVDQKTFLFSPKILTCRISRVNQLLGTQLSLREVASIFQRLELKIEAEKNDQLTVAIPSYRHDLKEEIDLIEEVARLYGYQHIPRKLPRHVSSFASHSPLFLFEEEARITLIAQGLQEFITCNLISPTLANLTIEKDLNEQSQIHVLSPSSIDQSVLRTSLLPGLLQLTKFNLDRQNENLFGFEVGKIHFKDKNQFIEQSVAGLLLLGKNAPYHFDPKPRDLDFFDLKGILENFLEKLGIELVIFERGHSQNFHPGRQARIKINDCFIGIFGEVHPAHLATLDIKEKVYYAEINLNDLLSLRTLKQRISPPPIFPGSKLDWTFTIKEEIPIGFVLNTIENFSLSKILEKIHILDLYKSEKIGKDRKNVTLRFYYRDPEKTLSFNEIEKEHEKIIAHISEKLKNDIL